MKIATVVVISVAAVAALSAQDFRTLAHFDGQNGARPWGALVQGLDGDFYSTTAGVPGNLKRDRGLIFKVTRAAKLSTVRSLPGSSVAGLLLATDGDFYGTTSGGFSGRSEIFKVSAKGALTTLYIFCEQTHCPDGKNAAAPLIQGSDGDFYGTTADAGANRRGGTIFKITRSGTLTTLYNFCAQAKCADGANPYGPLLEAADGNFYGATQFGGNQMCAGGCGTIFKVTPAGALTTLYSFCAEASCPDSATPMGGLIQAADGNLYGTTYGDGVDGDGTVYKITTAGALTTLYSFCAQPNCSDGAAPQAGLIQATDGNFYGATSVGANGFGTIFQMTPAGALTTLHAFCAQKNCADGAAPSAPLIQGTDGNFYGTSYGNVAPGLGTAYTLSIGMTPFVTTLPATGKIGSTVTILGNSLTGATKVTFNGTSAASFTVNTTGSAISVKVPAHATTGTVQVVTPSATLSSNVAFQVK